VIYDEIKKIEGVSPLDRLGFLKTYFCTMWYLNRYGNELFLRKYLLLRTSVFDITTESKVTKQCLLRSRMQMYVTDCCTRCCTIDAPTAT
jgi:hypothetical protein